MLTFLLAELWTFVIFLGMVVVLILLGQRLLSFFRLSFNDRIFILALAYIVGLTIFVLGLEALALIGWFTIGGVVTMSVVGIGIRLFSKLHRPTLNWQWPDWPKWRRLIWAPEAWLLMILLLLIAVNVAACFAPPTAWDEIAYHLPEAKDIVAHHRYIFPVFGARFYGDLPLSMETLYALAIKVRGYSLVHLLHFSYILALIAAVIGFVRSRFSLKAGLLTGILIFFVPEFISNGVSGYIDAAEGALEVFGILLLICWLERKHPHDALLAGLMWGTALGIKYSAFYGLLTAIVVTLGIYIWRIRRFDRLFWQSLGWFATGVVAFGGLWYIKNLIMYHNPVYPFFFAHPGLSDAEVKSIGSAVKSFAVPRTLSNFVQIPKIFWQSEAGLYNLFVVSLLAVPFAFLRRKGWRVMAILSALSLVNLAVWFFAASHQLRFLFATMIIIAIIGAIGLVNLHLTKITVLAPVVAGVLVINFLFHFLPYAQIKTSLIFDTGKVEEVAYASGRIDRLRYLHYKLGDFIYVTDYINKHYQNAVALNFWNHTADFYLERGNQYTSELPDNQSYDQLLHARGITLLAIDVKLRQKFIDLNNWGSFTPSGIAFENYFIAHATERFDSPNGQLYELNQK